MEDAQLKVVFQVPFFAAGVSKLPVVWDETIPTACTDGERIRYNPNWFDKWNDQEAVTVLCEEVGHCLLGHLWRAPEACDWKLWNQACDQEVRNMMAEFAEKRKAKGLADPFPFPDPEKSTPNPVYRGMAAEIIYQILASQPKSKQPGNQQQQQQGGSSQQKPGAGKPQPGKGAGKPQPGKGPPKPGAGDGEPEPFAEFEQPKKGDAQAEQKAKQQQNQWQSTLIQSLAAAKGQGHVPAGLKRFCDELINPKLPWWEILRSFLREQCNDDYCWTTPNPYYDDCEFILPAMESERMGTVIMAKDTSGSIDKRLLATFIAEEQNCLDDMRPDKIVDICCDSAIHRVKEYTQGDKVDGDAPGGGGTSFVPIFDYIEEHDIRPKCLVIFTDLDGAFPKREPDYPVLWVRYNTNKKAPFGETVEAS